MKIVIGRHTENERVIFLNMVEGMDIYIEETTDHETQPPDFNISQANSKSKGPYMVIKTLNPLSILPHGAQTISLVTT